MAEPIEGWARGLIQERRAGGIGPMLKIERLEGQDDPVTLRLEGRVIGPWVDEVRRSCEPLLAEKAGIALDLSGVAFIDRDGVALFRRLRQSRVALLNCSAFLAEQLKG